MKKEPGNGCTNNICTESVKTKEGCKTVFNIMICYVIELFVLNIFRILSPQNVVFSFQAILQDRYHVLFKA